LRRSGSASGWKTNTENVLESHIIGKMPVRKPRRRGFSAVNIEMRETVKMRTGNENL
jgi:hypothetical protein